MHPEDLDDSEATRQDLDPSMMETQAGEVAALRPAPQGPARVVVKPRRTDPEFPVTDWDRYTLVGFLGQGGMGKVFLARDKRLGREVAIKFVRVEDDRYLSRFLGEARTQARVDHPHVCKVFEVGEVEGKVFIAMQHIKGLPLDAAALRLTVEQKAMVLRDAALGLHEAHRLGIIHRDIKPSNILVEQGEDGLDHAYVMDFGLAHEWNTESSETGSVLGTPSYMSPEQARGEVSRLDRRSDVYSLGATLYHALSGHSPVEGSNALEIISAVSSSDPKPFRALKLDIPKDLEAITLKCLEKDRSRRYDSAKALAEDLDRFLAGDPVLARPTGLWYRLQRKARKHKQLTGVVLGALVLVLVAGGFALKARRDADRREVLARRFTESMARIESMARYSALAPAHDIRPDLQAVRDQMAELRRDMAEAGPLADGPGHYALGWGYWTLDDGEQAREHLQMAWDAGFREPRVAYALSLAMGQLYREQLLEAQRITTAAQRRARLEELAASLRQPLLGYLHVARQADLPSPGYLDAQIAFAEGHLEEALGRLKTVGMSQPWFYEAPVLQGSLFQARAWERWNKGDRAGALEDFAAARQELQKAATVARSGPAIRAALGDLEFNVLLMDKYSQGTDTQAFRRGMEAVTAALDLFPDHVPSLVVKSALLGSEADQRSRRGENAEPLAEEAVATANRAVAAGPFRADARKALGYACYDLGDAQSARGKDPSAALRRGIQAFESLSERKRDGRVWLHLGLIHQTQADFDTTRGKDPSPELNGAIAAFQHAAAMDPQAVPPRINLGTCLYQRGCLPDAAQPEEDLRSAQMVLEEAQRLNPQHFVPSFVLAKVRLAQGLRARARGEDALPHLEASLGAARRSLEINATVPNLHLNVAVAASALAQETWDRGQDPKAWLEQALQAGTRAVAAAPRLPLAHNIRAEVFLLKARLTRNPGDLAQAEAGSRRALQLAPEDRSALMNLGRTLSTRALWTLEAGGDPAKGVALALPYLEQALRVDERNSDAWQFLGECRSVAARGQLRTGGAASGSAAEAALRRALALAPTNQEPALEIARLALAGLGSKPQALDRLNRILQARPQWAEARALRGALLALPEDPDPMKAREDLTEALHANPNLTAEWAPLLARLKGAAAGAPRP